MKYHQITIEEAIQQQKQDEALKRVFCRRCGRELKSKLAKELGFGPSCYKKYMKECNNSNRKKLFIINKEG